MGQNLGWFRPGIAHGVVVRCQLGLQLSEHLPEAGGFAPKVAHASSLQTGAVPLHVDLSVGLLECPHNMVAGLPREVIPETTAEAAMPVLA